MAHIVVGYDGSDASDPALRLALREAARTGSSLRVVTVWRNTPYVGAVPGYGYDVLPAVEDNSEALRTMAADAVAGARAAIGAPDVTVDLDVAPGDPGTQLVKAAATAEMLVIGTRHHGGVVSAMVGSATNYVLHHAPCPVVVVRPEAPATWGKVVVGVDGSDCSLAALRWGATRARQSHCPLVVAHAWDARTAPDWFTRPAPDLTLHDKQVHGWLQEFVTDVVGNADLEIELRSIHDRAASGLLGSTAAADLLVVGSRGRGGFKGLVLGSVSMACVHHAICSVAVLRAGTGPTP